MSQVSNQSIYSLKVVSLKSLKNVEVDFQGKNVTAILGPNGHGKSTVLHALACVYSPLDQTKGEDYKFSDFFLPNTDAAWNNSSFTIDYTYREKDKVHDQLSKNYQKTEARWTPRYVNRPKREIYYIGIDTCVPMIESETKKSKVNYSTDVLQDAEINKVLEKASYILNKRYTKCNQHKSASKVKEFIGVETQMLKYSAISMSAGEQKVFYILRKLYQAGKNSLILIDELDLLLHDDALKKLLDVIVKRAEEKKLQVIFTTHRESIALITDINIRHIYDSGKQTFCFKETTPDSIQRLTGTFTRLINIFVEDDVSAQIINHTCGALGIKKHVDVSRFGAASNCFAMASGLFLKTPDLENVLFVWDGDIEQYRSDDQKNTALKKVLSGDDPKIQSIRDKVRSVITEYVVDTGISPEMFIFDVIRNDLSEDTLPNDEKEIYRIVYNLPIQSDSHDYINKVLEELNEARAAGLSKIIALASKSPRWAAFISPIKTWLESKMDLCLGKK